MAILAQNVCCCIWFARQALASSQVCHSLSIMSPAAKRRRLKLNVSRESLPVKVESIRCIRGGVRKEWLVLETNTVMGRECVSIGSTKQWLHILLSGQVYRSAYYHAINNFVAECFVACKAAKGLRAQPVPLQDTKDKPVPLHDKQDGGAASSQVAKKGRAAVFAAGDDDSEDQPRAIVPRKQGRKGMRPVAVGWATVRVRNMSIVCLCRRGRQVLVPVGTEDLDHIVQELVPRAGENPIATPGNFTDLLDHMDENLITWRLARRRSKASSQALGVDRHVGHWHVHYTDKEGKACETSVGLGVPQASLAGLPLAQEEKLQVARQVLVRARREWTRLDCSDIRRFPLC